MENTIGNDIWNEFYAGTQGQSKHMNGDFNDVRQEHTDDSFTQVKQNSALNKLSNGKAWGPDPISNEFLKKTAQSY